MIKRQKRRTCKRNSRVSNTLITFSKKYKFRSSFLTRATSTCPPEAKTSLSKSPYSKKRTTLPYRRGCVFRDFTCMKKYVGIAIDYMIIIHIYAGKNKKKHQIDAHKLALSVYFPIPFDGGEGRPGLLHLLSWHICSCYGPLVTQELNLLIILRMTVF